MGDDKKNDGDKPKTEVGKHRAKEERPTSGPVGHRLEQPHHPDGWFSER